MFLKLFILLLYHEGSYFSLEDFLQYSYFQVLEVGLVLLFIAGVAHAQKGGAKGAMRKGGKGGGGGRGGGGGHRHMEEFEDSKYYIK